MNAKQARAATTKALTKKQREAEEESRLEKERQLKNDEWSRTSAYPSFMKDVVWKAVKEATDASKKHTAVSTTNHIVADLATKKLVADEYAAHMKDVFVPEDREYGSSGEGMHDSYTLYVIHINWGRKGECPSCDEDFRRSQSRW